MLEVLGIVLIVQGAGGLINALAGSSDPGWWLQLHVLPPGRHVLASVAMLAAGVLLELGSKARERDGRRRR
jgi:hypothetical protein